MIEIIFSLSWCQVRGREGKIERREGREEEINGRGVKERGKKIWMYTLLL